MSRLCKSHDNGLWRYRKADQDESVVQLGSWLTKYSKLKETGFFHIFASTVVNKVLTMILSIALVRIMSKQDFGAYSYAFNIVSFLVLFNGLGAPSAVIQLCSEFHGNASKVSAFFRYGYKAGALFDTALCALILTTGVAIPLAVTGSNQLLILFFLYPLLNYLCDIKFAYLRVELLNKEYAAFVNLQTVLWVVASCGGGLLAGGTGVVIGQTAALAMTALLLLIRFPLKKMQKEVLLSRTEKRDYWNIAIISSVNTGLSQALNLLGVFLVGMYLANDYLVAEYKVATTIPYAITFIPMSLITYVYPLFARNKNDIAWTMKYFVICIGALLVVVGLLCAIFAVFADPLFCLLFGDEYVVIVPEFLVMLLGAIAVNCFGRLSMNLLITQRMIVVNTVITILAIVANIVASAILIPAYGLMGAAWTWTGCMFVMSVCSFVCYFALLAKRWAGEKGGRA